MKHKLCLHGLEVKNQAQLLNLAKRLLPGSTVKVKNKEKYFNVDELKKGKMGYVIKRFKRYVKIWIKGGRFYE